MGVLGCSVVGGTLRRLSSWSGLEITSLDICVVGVAGGRDATDAFRRRAKGKMRTRKKEKKLSRSNALGRDRVSMVISSVAVASEDLGRPGRSNGADRESHEWRDVLCCCHYR